MFILFIGWSPGALPPKPDSNHLTRLLRSTDASRARDQGSLKLIAVLWWIGIAKDLSLSLLLPQASISWRGTSVFFVGICLMLLGIALRWYSPDRWKIELLISLAMIHPFKVGCPVPIVSVEIRTSGAVVTERQRQGQRPCSPRKSLYSFNPPQARI
jgi:hypothetical protein